MGLKKSDGLNFDSDYRGGGETKEVALLSITTAPTGTFAVGSKYYNLTDKKIYTAVVADSWDGATVDDPQFGTYYLYDNSTYVWDGNSLEEYELENFVKKTDIVNDLTTADRTKVLSAEQGKVLNDTKSPILEVDNIINENSYNVVSNKAIAERIKANTTTVVDDVVDVLPTADTLDKKVLLTTDNKIYNTVKEKEINSAYSITGNLTIDSKGNISGFSDTNYLTLTSQFWVQLFPIKLRVVFNMTSSVEVPFLQLFRNDNNSLLFSLSAYAGVASNDHRFVAKVYDGSVPVPSANKTCLILVFNKIGFYKEW